MSSIGQCHQHLDNYYGIHRDNECKLSGPALSLYVGNRQFSIVYWDKHEVPFNISGRIFFSVW